MNLNDPRVIRTLKLIDDAFIANLKNTSFHKMTIEQICREAGINRTTFYKYYQDKFMLLDSFHDRILHEFKHIMDASFITAAENTIGDATYMNAFHQSMQFIERKREQYIVLWKSDIPIDFEHEMTAIVCENILDNISSSQREKDHKKYCELYAWLFASNMMALVNWWFDNYDKVTGTDVERLMKANMEKGMFKTFKSLL